MADDGKEDNDYRQMQQPQQRGLYNAAAKAFLGETTFSISPSNY